MTSGAPIASSHQNVPPPWSRVRLLRVDHFPGVSAAFDEIVEGMAYALHALGVTVDVAFNAPLTGGAVNIVIGAHGIPFRRGFPALPKRSIILNLEPPGSLAVQTQAYEQLLQSYPVWEYSDKNFELRKSAGQSNFVKFDIGYTPQLTRIKEAENHDVDVLFYGSVNDRRKQILDRIEAAGLRVHRAFGKFGAERDEMISRSKIVLNVHYHLDSIFEIVRCSYLLSNKKAVVCEVGSGTEIPADLRSAVVGCAYEDLVGACVSLARSEDARRRVAERGFELFSKRDQASLIARAMAETTWT
jgi:hypothetical protein